MSSLRGGMVTMTLVVCAGLAAAAHTGLGGRAGGDDTDASLMDETTGSVGSRSHAELALSDEQRGRIFDGVMLVPDRAGRPCAGACGGRSAAPGSAAARSACRR